MRFPLLVKVGALGAVVVALLIGLQMIQAIVQERQGRQREAEQSVVDGLAAQQAVLGPVLQRDCTETWERVEGEGKDRRRIPEQRETQLTAWPSRLEVDAGAAIEARHRGLFKFNAFTARMQAKAQWNSLAALQPPAPAPGHAVRCSAPVLALAVSDARGIQAAVVRSGGETPAVLPGSRMKPHSSGFHAVLAERSGGHDAPLQVEIDLKLAGTRGLAWIPVADQTQVKLTADWPHPSFGGRFLPAKRNVHDQGFEAEWQISSLATTVQQAVLELPSHCKAGLSVLVEAGCLDHFGVSFIDPVNAYVLSDRAVKYGLLFIGLTFIGVALVEVLRRLRVHPVQYLLVGCALTLFFLLLLSLSEHLAFHLAYAVAASACAGLLTFYGCHVLHGIRPGLLFGGAIGLLYGALYALLQMEQTALVIGSLLLFGVLAAVMVATRRVDWYGLTAQWREDASS